MDGMVAHALRTALLLLHSGGAGDCRRCRCRRSRLSGLESLLIPAAVLVVATTTHVLLQDECSGMQSSGSTHSQECERQPSCSVAT